jgi:hypothetical protein
MGSAIDHLAALDIYAYPLWMMGAKKRAAARPTPTLQKTRPSRALPCAPPCAGVPIMHVYPKSG